MIIGRRSMQAIGELRCTAPDSRHFHAPQCAFARTIPERVRRWIYSKKEGLKLGKIACMNCL
jgi:hypothetical protein